eukprot:CAMPEP_0201475290 /NCGR_PEP_ID=MMETSP0151_2-20130828/743_1 /ASSEMBLY_ACC=CAM_ASM_000257 /TAXON_ID=200890 /ORGANISM="Paramoeba atlantica, Strain 621/1 / CCAP 1560/9" /LENGTH=270 /DNA_ID=CAMNT_0047855343 /DNA_START=38 /DNA_END=850 /DNA_ORIENTATION=+
MRFLSTAFFFLALCSIVFSLSCQQCLTTSPNGRGKWETIDQGVIVLETDFSLGVCINNVLPRNSCKGNAECEVPIDNAYSLTKEEFRFFESSEGDEYFQEQRWKFRCAKKITVDDDLGTFFRQKGTFKVEEIDDENSTDSDFGGPVCEVTLKPFEDDCLAFWDTGGEDGYAMCNMCADACDDCDGDWSYDPDTGDSTCISTDDKFQLQERCPQICPEFKMEGTTTRTFYFNEDCTAFESEYYDELLAYQAGSFLLPSLVGLSFVLFFSLF